MFSIILAAGWPIWPLLCASIIAVALIIERLVTLRRAKVLPTGLLQRVVGEYRQQGANEAMLANLEAQSARRRAELRPQSGCRTIAVGGSEHRFARHRAATPEIVVARA